MEQQPQIQLQSPPSLQTRKGTLQFPAIVPTLCFKIELDMAVRHFISSTIAPNLMVSARFLEPEAMADLSRNHCLMIDSGGFALLTVKKATWQTHRDGTSSITIPNGKATILSPQIVLQYQEEWADIGFTLDIPIPPGSDKKDAQTRMEASYKNAMWALAHRERPDLPLFGVCPYCELDTMQTVQLALRFANAGFEGIALGGVAKRQLPECVALVKLVRGVLNGSGFAHLPIHVLGHATPWKCYEMFNEGASCTDGSTWSACADEGKLLVSLPDGNGGYRQEYHPVLASPSLEERVHLALINLCKTTGSTMPMTVANSPMTWNLQKTLGNIGATL